MRLLITGGAGYIGSHILTEILPLRHKVCVIDDFSNGRREALELAAKLSGFSFDTRELDLCDSILLHQVFSEFKPQAVVHLAGLKSVGESSHLPIRYYEKNVGGTIQLLRAMDTFGCKKIIFSSSATVYAEQMHPIDELQSIKPINPYGRTKFFTEEIIRDWTMTEQSKSAVILRYFNPVGAHKSGEMGENPILEPSNLMPLIAQVGSGCRPKINVFGDDYNTKDGTPIRDYIHILDLVTGHLAGLEYAIKNSGYEVFNLGTGTGYSVLEVINAFESETGVKITFEMRPRRAGDVCASVANSSKACRLLGWKPQFTLKDMCEDVWRWQIKKTLRNQEKSSV